MPDFTAFLAVAEAESKMPSVSVGLASGMVPPPLRELMRQAEGESASKPGSPPPLPPDNPQSHTGS